MHDARALRHRMACTICAVLPVLAGSPQTVWAAVRLGVTGGIQSTRLTGLWPSSDFTYNSPYDSYFYSKFRGFLSWAGEFGVVVEVPVRGSSTFSSGLSWSAVGDRASYMYTANTPPNEQMRNTVHTSLEMIALPLRLEEWRSSWHFGLGPELRYLVRAIREIDNHNLGSTNTNYPYPSPGYHEKRYTSTRDVSDRYRRWSVALSGHAGRALPAGRHLLRATLRWTEGITNVSTVDGPTRRIRAAQVALAFLW